MKLKKKVKKTLIMIGVVLVVGVGLFFVNSKFKLFDKMFGVGEVDGEVVIPEEKEVPKLKIVDEDSDSRVVAVMINNNHNAWEHAGLEDAFLNYEIVVEGGITRILSLFKDADTSKIGSIRSARHYFLDYVLENDAIYVHHGHSPYALDDISELGVDNINGMYDAAGFYRETGLDRDYEHTSFTNFERINDVIADKEYRNTSSKDLLLNYSIEEVDLSLMENSIRADEVRIEYSDYQTTSYVYDEEDKIYLRSMSDDGEDVSHTDLDSGKQYKVKNIITYQIKNWTIDSSGRQDIDNVGSGEGYYISNGYAVAITWEKASRSSETVYKYKNGKEIDVNDGVTWIQIQPMNKELDIISNEVVENEEVE